MNLCVVGLGWLFCFVDCLECFVKVVVVVDVVIFDFEDGVVEVQKFVVCNVLWDILLDLECMVVCINVGGIVDQVCDLEVFVGIVYIMVMLFKVELVV